MTVAIRADPLAGASHVVMIDHLTGPFAAGAVEDALPISPVGRVQATNFREALVVLAPRAPLAEGALRVVARLDPDGVNRSLTPVLSFARYTDAFSFLPLYRPTDPFVIQLEAERVADDGSVTPLDPAALGATLEVRLIQGVMGRMIFALGAEKARIRRVAREISAMRRLSLARLDALDRIGACLAVPRFVDDIGFDAGRREIVTISRPPDQPEPDPEYARRLRIYHPWRLPNRAELLGLLNGPGADADPNRGLLAGLGLTHRLSVLEEDNEFAIGLRLISAGPDQLRLNFLEHIRATRLVLPASDPAADAVHAARFLPSERKTAVDALRATLRSVFTFAPGHAIAPRLAECLDRAGRLRQALGLNTPIPVARAQDPAGGSRLELGLGVEVDMMAAADVDAIHVALTTPGRPPLPDAELEGLLRQMTPKPAAQEPEATWFFKACGLRTAHRLSSGRLYLSHLPTFGLEITAASNAAPNAVIDMAANYHAPGDPGSNLVLLSAIADAAGRWTGGGEPAFTTLSRVDAEGAWGAQVVPAASAQAALQDAGLRAVTAPPAAEAGLRALPPELVATIALDPAQGTALLNDQAGASDDLARLVELLREAGISAVLPIVTGAGRVLLVVGVVGLPEVGTNLSDRRSTGFRWYAIPLRGPAPEVKPLGSRSTFKLPAEGLSAVVVIGYARRGLTDPYEYRVDLPEGALLSLRQYEFLMNLLDHVHPLGIEVNTYRLRHSHVDLDGDGSAEPLPPRISRTFRRFRRPRLRGEAAAMLAEPSGADA